MEFLAWVCLFFALGLVAGVIVGRWWALLLALLVPVAFVPFGEDSDAAPEWETGLVLYAPITLIGIAVGVAARRRAGARARS
jgi:hypothetical protein